MPANGEVRFLMRELSLAFSMAPVVPEQNCEAVLEMRHHVFPEECSDTDTIAADQGGAATDLLPVKLNAVIRRDETIFYICFGRPHISRDIM